MSYCLGSIHAESKEPWLTTGAMQGGERGKSSKCVWIDAYHMKYASFLCMYHIPEFYILVHHNTKSKTQVALWQKESDDTAKSALVHAQEGQMPMLDSPDDTPPCFHHGVLVANIVCALEIQYNSNTSGPTIPW